MADCDLSQTQPVAPQPRNAAVDESICARLCSLTDVEASHELRHGQTEFVIGRHPGCQIVVADRRASGRHLRIFRDGEGRFFAQELSANGCWLNEFHMSNGDIRVLRNGDQLSLCVRANAKSVDKHLRPFAAWVFRIAQPSTRASVQAQQPSAAIDTSGADAKDSCRVTEQWVADRWDTRTVIGQGNFSEVRLGVKVKDGTTFAIKVVDVQKFVQFQNKRASRLTLRSEAQVLMSLNHPGIIRFFDLFESEAKLYLVMELVNGGDMLQCILDGGGFAELQAKRLFHQVCDAVKYLHERHIVHRDLKPENILLSSKDRATMDVKIGDFGLARESSSSDMCKTFCGTPHYFAPEVILSAGTSNGYDKQVDMWSLGVVLYIMLCGAPPFDDEELYKQILSGRCEFDLKEWAVVSAAARELVKGLMAVDPKLRLTDVQALDHIANRWTAAPRSECPPRTPLRRSSRGVSADEKTQVSAAKRRRSDESDIASPFEHRRAEGAVSFKLTSV